MTITMTITQYKDDLAALTKELRALSTDQPPIPCKGIYTANTIRHSINVSEQEQADRVAIAEQIATVTIKFNEWQKQCDELNEAIVTLRSMI